VLIVNPLFAVDRTQLP